MKIANMLRVCVVLAVAVFAVAAADSAQAGIFGKLKCKLHSLKCCEPACCEEETCCEAEPTCCEAAPTCCEEPAPCCEAAPEPCCEPVVEAAPCCEAEPVCCEAAPVCCEAEPTCCEEPTCCDSGCGGHLKGLFAKLRNRNNCCCN